ncbi:MAG: hypothetical protein ABIG44_17650 [Planctomycetota bacterium]
MPGRDLLTAVEHVWVASDPDVTISKYAYVNDDLARRESVVNRGEAVGGTSNEHLSIWSYNERNELTGSARYADDNPESPQNPLARARGSDLRCVTLSLAGASGSVHLAGRMSPWYSNGRHGGRPLLVAWLP